MARRDDAGWELPASKAAGGLSTPSQVRADLTRPLGTHRSHRGHTGGLSVCLWEALFIIASFVLKTYFLLASLLCPRYSICL